MKPQPCPRLFEAEAMRDGRLTGAERAGFERHAKACSACARELRALDALAEALRTDPPEDEDELRVRRQRTRLLAAFDRDLLGPERPSTAAPAWLWSAGLAALVVCALGVWRMRRSAEPMQVTASRAQIHAEASAAWSERIEGDREWVVLERGELWIHVDHAAPARRLVVVLPDGEIEDTGTTFTVSAADGRTTRVAVQEGGVVLRLHRAPDVVLHAGEVWLPAPPPAIASASASTTPPGSPSPRPPAVSGRQLPRPTESSPSGVSDDTSLDFRAATGALERGENQDAASRFARFVSDHPSDPRAEDAAYLRVIALQRSGDGGGMREAALDYLRRYPAGFRRAEVEPLAR